MLRDIFKTVGGYEGYGMVSMVIFFVFFTLLVLYAFSIRRKDLDDFSRMPFDDRAGNSDQSTDV